MSKTKPRFVRSKTFRCPEGHSQRKKFMAQKRRQGLEPWTENYEVRGIPKDVVYYYSRKKLRRR